MSKESGEQTSKSRSTLRNKRLCVVRKGWVLVCDERGRRGWSVPGLVSANANCNCCAHRCVVATCATLGKIVARRSRVLIGRILACALVKIVARRLRATQLWRGGSLKLWRGDCVQNCGEGIACFDWASLRGAKCAKGKLW